MKITLTAHNKQSFDIAEIFLKVGASLLMEKPFDFDDKLKADLLRLRGTNVDIHLTYTEDEKSPKQPPQQELWKEVEYVLSTRDTQKWNNVMKKFKIESV